MPLVNCGRTNFTRNYCSHPKNLSQQDSTFSGKGDMRWILKISHKAKDILSNALCNVIECFLLKQSCIWYLDNSCIGNPCSTLEDIITLLLNWMWAIPLLRQSSSLALTASLDIAHHRIHLVDFIYQITACHSSTNHTAWVALTPTLSLSHVTPKINLYSNVWV